MYSYGPLAEVLNETAPVSASWRTGCTRTRNRRPHRGHGGRNLRTIRAVLPHDPFLVGGASLGGGIAYQMTHLLHEAGEPVHAVVTMDSPSPRTVMSALDEDRLDLFIREGVAAEQISDDASIADVRRFVALSRSTSEVLRRFDPPHYPGDVLYFRATDADGLNPTDGDLRWRQLVSGDSRKSSCRVTKSR